jgi:hypothetical protein
MSWPATLPGRLLERIGDDAPRGMIAQDRTRLTGRLRPSAFHALHGKPPWFCDANHGPRATLPDSSPAPSRGLPADPGDLAFAMSPQCVAFSTARRRIAVQMIGPAAIVVSRCRAAVPRAQVSALSESQAKKCASPEREGAMRNVSLGVGFSALDDSVRQARLPGVAVAARTRVRNCGLAAAAAHGVSRGSCAAARTSRRSCFR